MDLRRGLRLLSRCRGDRTAKPRVSSEVPPFLTPDRGPRTWDAALLREMACSKIDGTGAASARGGSRWHGRPEEQPDRGGSSGGAKEESWANGGSGSRRLGTFFPPAAP